MKLKYLLAASAVSLSAAAVIAPAPVAAQQITTGIEGTVNDDAGNPLAGATVTITDARTGASRELTTGSDGRFTATGLVTGGPYTVAANAGGFEGQTINDIQTTLQGNTSLTFALSAGGGEIVVTGSRVQVTQLAVGPPAPASPLKCLKMRRPSTAISATSSASTHASASTATTAATASIA